MSGIWGDLAKQAIYRVHTSLPADVTLKDRTAAVDAAYPFGERAHFPYKAWLKCRREYLAKHGLVPKQAKHLSPLERAMQRSQR